MTIEIYQFAFGGDNYGVLVHHTESRQTACVDAGDGAAVLEALERTGWSLTQLWITHHHWDHVDGLAQVVAATGCSVRGPLGVKNVDMIVSGGDAFTFGGDDVQILHTPGHTLDMLNFYLPQDSVVFTADTLFVMGCGRLFEGTGPQMWESLQKLAALPRETQVYCGHEYTLANAAFAKTVDGSNPALLARIAQVETLRSTGKPTVPSTIGEELDTNPFLRAADPAIRKTLGMADATDAEVFTRLRELKDQA